MKIYFEPGQEPLAGVPRAQVDRVSKKLFGDLANLGIHVLGGNHEDRTVDLNLRNLTRAHGGNIDDAKQTLVATLKELGVVRVDVQPGDVEYLTGRSEGQQLVAVAVAAGLEDGDTAITEKLTSLEVDELIDAPFEAFDTLLGRPVDRSNPLNEYVEQQVEADLISRGLIQPLRPPAHGFWGTEKDPLGPPAEPEPQNHMGWGPANPLPYKSQWDSDDLG